MKNKWKAIAALITGILAACLLMLLLINAQPRNFSVKAVSGVINLTKEAMEKNGVVTLDGEWKFAEGISLIQNGSGTSYVNAQVPGVWKSYQTEYESGSNHKTGTFYLRINLPEQNTAKTWALYIPDVRTSRQVYINGVEVDRQGTVDEDFRNSVPYDLPDVVFFTTASGAVDLEICVSNNFYELTGGISRSVFFGTPDEIWKLQQSRNASDIGIALIFTSIGFIFFTLYLYRKKETILLIFSLFCVFWALLNLTNSELLLLSWFPDMSYYVFHKIQFITASASVFLLMLYARLAVPKQTRSLLYKVLLAVSALFMLVPMLLPVSLSTRFGYWHPMFFLLCTLSAIYSIMKAVVMGEEHAVYLYINGMSLLVYFLMNLLPMFGYYDLSISPLYAIVFFGLSNAACFAARFTKTQDNAEKLSAELVRQDQLKNEFLAKTSHEFRTPLHGIMNIVGMYIEKEKRLMSEEDLENMRLVVDNSKRLSRLVNDILDFDLIKGGKLNLDRTRFPLEQCLNDIVGICRRVYAGNGKEIELVADGTIPTVYLDRDRLTQIMFNLIDNAMNHTSADRIQIRAGYENGQAVISVCDNGTGIEAKRLETIFDLYEHFSDTKVAGSGIGLSIVKQLVQYMGGIIDAQSKVGEGTVFSLRFSGTALSGHRDNRTAPEQLEKWIPLPSPETESKAVVLETPYVLNQGGGATVLVVDDSFSNLKIIIDALKTDRHNIIAVTNGTELLEAFRAHPEIDLIVLDLLLPDYSGYELCKLLRERKSVVELPILILTAAINPDDLQYALSLGANDFIHKPYPVNELRARVNSLLYMKEASTRSAKYEIAFLHAQIKPHFLYNALNTIASCCETDAEEAGELILSLSRYLRGTLDFSNLETLVPADKELELVRAYLDIEKARFPELRVEINADEELDVQLPPMTLQVLVENAVKHGAMKWADCGTVVISMRHIAIGVRFSVQDDGNGMTEEQIDEILRAPKRESGIGLYNVHTRLIRIYGQGLSFEAAGNGMKVSFIIPKGGNT